MIGIYKITNPKGKIYIGQSTDIEDRWKYYYKLNCRGQRKLYFSLKKYGVINHVFEVIIECSVEELDELERCYQDTYYSIGEKSLNLMLTATKTRKGKHSEETKRRIGEGNKGRKMSEYTKMRIRESKKNYIVSQETRMKLSIAGKNRGSEVNERIANAVRGRKHSEKTKKLIGDKHRGRKHTEETRKKFSDAQKGKKQSSEQIKKRVESQKKVILDTSSFVFYNGLKDLVDLIGVNYDWMSAKLSGRVKNNTKYIYV